MDTYHTDITALSRSQLSIFHDDPETFRSMFIDGTMPRPRVGKPAALGKVAHECLLLGRPLHEVCAEIPADCLTKAGAINRARVDDWLAGRPILALKSDDYREVKAALAGWSLSLQRIIPDNVAHAVFETDHEARIGSVRIKARPDMKILCADGSVMIKDLKISDSLDDRSFLRSARDHKYWLQDAHYTRTISICMDDMDWAQIPFEFWTLERVPPYRAHMRTYSEESRARAMEEWEALIYEFAIELESGAFESRRTENIPLYDWELPLTQGALVAWQEDM